MTENSLAEARLDIHDFVTQTLTALSFEVSDDTSDDDIAELEELMSTISSVLLDALGLEVVSDDSTDEVESYTVKLTLLSEGPEEDDAAEGDDAEVPSEG
jgi:hypothetical protein